MDKRSRPEVLVTIYLIVQDFSIVSRIIHS